MIQRIFESKLAVAVGVGIISFVMYCITLAPSVTFIDSGELAAVASTLGIAHPTGYPLFTLLGWVFSQLPIGGEEIIRLNLMAALFCAIGVALFYLLLQFVLDTIAGNLKHADKVLVPRARVVAGVGGSLLLAFSETYWSTALSIEVYSLHLLFLPAVTLVFIRACLGERDGEPVSIRTWFLFAFLLGLSFTNHMTTILLAPGFLYLYFVSQKFSGASLRRLLIMFIPFILGLSMYLYLLVRASQSPLLNWGDTETLEKFLWHWTGKQYRVWIFSSTEAAGRQLKYFLETLPAEFAYVGIPLALAGIVSLTRLHRTLGVTILLLFAGCVAYSINYDIHDIDSYFLLAYMCMAIWIGIGLFVAILWIEGRLSGAGYFLAIGCMVASFSMNYGKVDESDNYLVHDYTMNMFSSLKPDALILSYQWDYWLSASYYYQFVRGVRPDVAVVDKELLRRSWYFKEMENRIPWLIDGSRKEVKEFQVELSKFELGIPYNPAIIQSRFVRMIGSFLENNYGKRPIYVTYEIEPEFTAGFQRIPEGLAFRLEPDTLFHPSEKPVFQYRPLKRSGRLEERIPWLYSQAWKARASYYYRGGRMAEAEEAMVEARKFEQGFR